MWWNPAHHSAARPHVSSQRLRQILVNLLSNAIKFTDEGSVTFDVGYRSQVATFTVADTGRGMTSEEAARIFTDFYTTKEGGTGLGLSIVRRLVMDVQGTIVVDSTPGRGTRIVIEIPTGGRTSG